MSHVLACDIRQPAWSAGICYGLLCSLYVSIKVPFLPEVIRDVRSISELLSRPVDQDFLGSVFLSLPGGRAAAWRSVVTSGTYL